MLTIGLGPVSAGGGGGKKLTIFDLGFVETTATAKVTDTTITVFPMVDTSMVTDMSRLFYRCENLVSIPPIDTKMATNMDSMFYSCKRLEEIPMMDTSNVLDMDYTFYYTDIRTLPPLNTSNVIRMQHTFANCSLLEHVPELDVSNVTTLSSAFSNCHAIRSCFLKGLKVALELRHPKYLEKESVLYIFENAQTVTTSQTITLHADVFAQLTEDEIAIATEKGFSVVSA